MNTAAIQNPAAVVTSMNRPVIAKDIAEKLGFPISTVRGCMSDNPSIKRMYSTEKVALVRKTAQQMGYDKKDATSYALKMKNGRSACCWHNGNFKTREEEIAHMKGLRSQGYSNAEIAKKIGRCYRMVYNAIGKQDPELTKQNQIMANHIRSQKNAARKQYVVNKPIREYNKKVEEHNQLKMQVAKLEMQLRPQTPAIEKAAQTKIDFPLIDLHTVQPTALQ